MNRRGISPLLAAAVLAVSGTAVAQDEDVIHVDLWVSGGAYPGEGCKGGDWRLRWKGDLPSEGSSISDMLISYSAFDTTNEEDRVDPPADFRAYQDRFFALGELARQQRDRFDLCNENLPPGVESLRQALQ
jgi:hypothetical protein